MFCHFTDDIVVFLDGNKHQTVFCSDEVLYIDGILYEIYVFGSGSISQRRTVK